jgi:hypothetical protein
LQRLTSGCAAEDSLAALIGDDRRPVAVLADDGPIL